MSKQNIKEIQQQTPREHLFEFWKKYNNAKNSDKRDEVIEQYLSETEMIMSEVVNQTRQKERKRIIAIMNKINIHSPISREEEDLYQVKTMVIDEFKILVIDEIKQLK